MIDTIEPLELRPITERLHVLEYSAPRIDGGVIKGVKIIGLTSENGRSYSRAVLRAAKGLYESSPVFIEHPEPKEKQLGFRRLVDHFGSLQNIRERGNGEAGAFGIFGDLHVKMSHPLAAPVIEQIMKGDATFGLSHNAFVEMSDDRTQVLKINMVNSVDLVDKPATNANLFEETNVLKQLKALKTARDLGEVEPSEGKFETAVVEEITGLTKLIAAIKEDAAETRKLVNECLAEMRPPKTGKRKEAESRLTALENRSKEDPDPEAKPATGKTHDDFVAVLQGFPVTNAKTA